MRSLVQELRELEVELHHPGVRCDPQRLEQLLHPEFHEVGRSGRAYDRETVIRYLSSRPALPAVESDRFGLVDLGPDAALLTYRSTLAAAQTGVPEHTHRSSIWIKTDGRWQLRYHQGTAAAEEV
jgi:hypothetical protein